MRSASPISSSVVSHTITWPKSAQACRAIGAVGYGAGVIGRALAARRTGGRTWPDALAHPASVAAFAGLTALSWRRHDRGTLTWKGRTLP